MIINRRLAGNHIAIFVPLAAVIANEMMCSGHPKNIHALLCFLFCFYFCGQAPVYFIYILHGYTRVPRLSYYYPTVNEVTMESMDKRIT